MQNMTRQVRHCNVSNSSLFIFDVEVKEKGRTFLFSLLMIPSDCAVTHAFRRCLIQLPLNYIEAFCCLLMKALTYINVLHHTDVIS